MLTNLVLPIFVAGAMQAPMALGPTASEGLLAASNYSKSNCILISAAPNSGRVAPGPDHGPDPHNENHGGPLYSPDPYNYSTGNGSDPYGGTTSNGSDPYGGLYPGAPFPGDKYGGNVPD